MAKHQVHQWWHAKVYLGAVRRLWQSLGLSREKLLFLLIYFSILGGGSDIVHCLLGLRETKQSGVGSWGTGQIVCETTGQRVIFQR